MKRVLSLALVLILCIGVLTIGASAANADYTVCPGESVEISMTSSYDQSYSFTSDDGANISVVQVGSSAATATVGGITVGSYSRTYQITMTADGFHTITALGSFGGTTTFTIQVGHTIVVDSPAVAPTCTEVGWTESSHCSVCGEVTSSQTTIPATGHTVVTDAGKESTCTESGLTEGSHCSVCGEVLTAQEVIPASHTWNDGVVIKEPTETEKGEMSYVCLICGAEETRSIPAIHTPGDINDDGAINISDVQTLLKYVNGQSVSVKEAALDISGDDTVNISDVQTLLKYVNGQDVTIY